MPESPEPAPRRLYEPPPLAPEGDPITDWHRRACVTVTFDPIEFCQHFRTQFGSPEFRRLIADSILLGTSGEEARWSLKPDARRAALAQFDTPDALRVWRAAALAPADDPLQTDFDRVLSGQPIDIEGLTEDGLIRAEQVAVWLHGTPVARALPVPHPDAVRRHLLFLRQVKPLAERAPEPFVGRSAALARVREFVGGALGAPPLMLWGKAGIGKSAVAARFALEFLGVSPGPDVRRSAFYVRRGPPDRSGGPVVFLDLGEPAYWRDLPRYLLEEAARQLAAQAATPAGPPAAGRTESAVRVTALGAYCRTHWEQQPALFIVDGYDHVLAAGEPMHARVWSLLSDLTKQLPSARVLVLGRVLPGERSLAPGTRTRTDLRPPDPPREAEQFELTELERAESERLLERLGVARDDVPRICPWVGGNPLALWRVAETYKALPGAERSRERVEREYRCAWSAPRSTAGPEAVRIPLPPEAYVAHPYSLLRTDQLIGRRDELAGLSVWANDPASDRGARVLCVCASGGTGKSALAWHWFEHVAPKAVDRLEGRIWWSFYEPDADFESFVTRTLAYVSRRPVADVAARPFTDQLDDLFGVLDRTRYLIVLDGFERQLAAYARLDKGAVDTNEDLDREAEGPLRDAHRLTAGGLEPAGSRGAPRPPNELRAATFKEACRGFLQRLSLVQESRVLLSTRLFPADFQAETGEIVPGVAACTLRGLAEKDAAVFWWELGGTGAGRELTRWFDRFGHYPLLIQALAGGVVNDFEARGDFERWRERHAEFDVFDAPELQDVRNKVLTFAIQSLPSRESLVLAHLAVLRMAPEFNTLQAILVGPTGVLNAPDALRDALANLRKRGLVGQSPVDLRYDLHPMVRGVAARLHGARREDVLSRLSAHFSKFPKPDEATKDPQAITPHLEYYFLLTRQKRWDDAYEQFKTRLADVTRNGSGLMSERCVWLGELFEERSFAGALLVTRPDLRGHAFFAVAETLIFLAQFDRAVAVLERALRETVAAPTLETNLQRMLAYALCAEARFIEAERAAKRSLVTARKARDLRAEARSLLFLMWVYLKIGDRDRAVPVYRRARRLFEEGQETWSKALLDAEFFLGTDRLAEAGAAAEVVLAEAVSSRYEFGIADGHARCGKVALAAGNLADARHHFAEAHLRCISGGFVYKETDVLFQRGRLAVANKEWTVAREMADRVIARTNKGNYRLARIEAWALKALVAGRLAADGRAAPAEAVETARTAYELAWCDGGAYTYRHYLDEVAELLREDLREPPPVLPPTDPDRFPVIDVEIDPPPTRPLDTPDVTNWSRERLRVRLEATKELIGWADASHDVRKRWEGIERTHQDGLEHVCRLADDLARRSATVAEFFDAAAEAATDNLTAVLHYLDFLRLKTRAVQSKELELKPPSRTADGANEPSPRLVDLKVRLNWDKTTGSARKWWERFERTYPPDVVEGVAAALVDRRATVPEYFLAFVYSNCDDPQANLHYLDYMRTKKERERSGV